MKFRPLADSEDTVGVASVLNEPHKNHSTYYLVGVGQSGLSHEFHEFSCKDQ